jgi:proteic killer suppression protein
MIKSFRHKGLAELWSDGGTAKIDAKMHKRALRRLDALDIASDVIDVDFVQYH